MYYYIRFCSGAISYVGYGVLHDYGMKTYHYYMNLMTTETSTAWYYAPIRYGGQALHSYGDFYCLPCFFLILSFLSSPTQRWLSEQTEIALTGSKGEIKRKKVF